MYMKIFRYQKIGAALSRVDAMELTRGNGNGDGGRGGGGDERKNC